MVAPSFRVWRLTRRSVAALVFIALVFGVRVVAHDVNVLHARTKALGEFVQVLELTHNKFIGAHITAEDLRVVSRYQTQIENDATIASQRSKVLGALVQFPIARGSLLRASSLTRTPKGRARISNDATVDLSNVPSGMRVERVADTALLQPPTGSVIDIWVSYPNEIGGAPTNAQRTVQGAIVMSNSADMTATDGTDTSRNPSPDVTQQGTANGRTLTNSLPASIMVLIRAEDARSLATASGVGAITLALAPLEDACCNPFEHT